ncbi:MAG TPA: cell wall hydrolase [Desulfosporosinus sp.]
MCLFLWQVSIYPVLGQGYSGAVLPYHVAKEGTKKPDNVKDNALETTTTGTIKIIVQPGETLWALAQRYHTTVDEIVKINQAKSPDQISVGEVLWIPTGNSEAKAENPVIEDVKNYLGDNTKPATVTDGNSVKSSWWVTILRSVPVFAAVFKQGSNAPHSSGPQQSDAKIPTYEIFVNQDTPSIDKSTESSPDDQDDAQKPETQKTVPIGSDSQVLSRSLGRLVSKEDVELLTRVIYGEARGENFEGQVAVGAVVINRLKDPRFPKTMRAIIYQSGAFTAVDDKQIHLNPDDQAYKAAEAALSGLDPTNGAIYYYNPRIATDRWIKTRPVIKRIGNHTFSI